MADSLTQDSRMQVDGKAEDSSKARNPLDTQSLLALLGEEEVDPSTLPARLLAEMDSYVPTIPEPVLTHFLQKSGCHVTDPKMYLPYFPLAAEFCSPCLTPYSI